MSYIDPRPIAPMPLSLGQKVKLDGKSKTWCVQAVSEGYVALVQQAPFEKKGVLQYTVIDWEKGVRGPCNNIGQGFGDGSYSEAECARMLEGFEYRTENDPNYIAAKAAGENSWPSPLNALEVSARNWVRVTAESVEVTA